MITTPADTPRHHGKWARSSSECYSQVGQMVVGPPKTPRSERAIALDRTTVAALRRHWQQQAIERIEGGPSYQDSGFVFTGLRGDPMAPDRLTRTSRRLTVETGMPPIRLHDVRHGIAPYRFWPPGWIYAWCRTCSGTAPSCSPPTPTPPSYPTSPESRRTGRRARPARRPPRPRHQPATATHPAAATTPTRRSPSAFAKPRAPGTAGPPAQQDRRAAGRRLTQHPLLSLDRSVDQNRTAFASPIAHQESAPVRRCADLHK